jgi:RNA polymerase sigma-70 factor (ECF subfamily)
MKDLRTSRHEAQGGAPEAELASERIGAETLFREHAEFVASFLHRLGVHPSDVDDVVQDVFVVAHEKGGYERGPAKPRSWLAAIAVRLAKAQKRKRARRREDYDEVAIEATRTGGDTPAGAAEVAQALLRVQCALDTMDLEHRAVFILYEIEGQSCGEISAALEIPTGTVYSRLHNARKRFVDAHANLAKSDEPRASEPDAGAPVDESPRTREALT